MWSGIILASLKADGKTPLLNERLIICCNGEITADKISLTIVELDPSVPSELPGFTPQTILIISDWGIGPRKIELLWGDGRYEERYLLKGFDYFKKKIL